MLCLISMTYPEVRHRYVMKVKRWVLPEIGDG
jgi:hypothetical protein